MSREHQSVLTERKVIAISPDDQLRATTKPEFTVTKILEFADEVFESAQVQTLQVNTRCKVIAPDNLTSSGYAEVKPFRMDERSFISSWTRRVSSPSISLLITVSANACSTFGSMSATFWLCSTA